MRYTVHFITGEEVQLTANDTYISEVFLLVAQYYGEKWYGCSVRDENGNIYCNAVKECYTEEDPSKTVYQWALEKYNISMRIRNGLCSIYEDDEGTEYRTNYNPFVQTKESNG